MLSLGEGLRGVHRQGHAVGEEIAEEVNADGDHQRRVHAVAPADQLAGEKQDSRKNSQQQCCFDGVHKTKGQVRTRPAKLTNVPGD